MAEEETPGNLWADVRDAPRPIRIVLGRVDNLPLVLVVDNIEYRIVPGSRPGSLEIFSPGKSILYSQVDNYTLEVW